jgi:hypothetical protein
VPTKKDKQPLSITHPDIAKQAFGWDPSQVKASDSLKRNWKCSKGHEFLAASSQRTRPDKPSGCPYCSGKKVLKGLNDLATTHPELAQYAHNWDPTRYSAGSAVKMEWKCQTGHIFHSRITDATRRNSKIFCSVCNGHSVLVGFNDLATSDPAVAAEAHNWDPRTVTRGSNRKRQFKCPAGHIYESVVATRAIEGRGCRICRNQEVVVGFNDLSTKFPKIAKEANGWDPTKFVFGSTKRMSWKCREGHFWETTIIGRTQGEKGCPYCSGFKTWPGFNDLATTHPHLINEAYGWDPKTIHAGTNKKLSWKCSLGHIWEASGTSRSANDSGCPYCSNFSCLTGFNDLSTTHPELVAEANGWDATKVIAGSNKKKSWRCSLGHTWSSSVVNRAYGKKTGCPECAISGFKPEQDAWVYLIIHHTKNLRQIGITNDPDQRVALHKSKGWQVLDLVGPIKGKQARKIEEMVLAKLWREEIRTGKRAGLRKFDGYTESWLSSDFNPNLISEIVNLTEVV